MLENNLQYNDEYIYFAFNGIHSSKHNLMIQNNIDDFKIITNENTSIDYASPKYQNGRYMMGVTRSHRTIPHKLVAYGLTRAEANQVAEWLRVGCYGPLIYDYAPDWQYNVVVSKLGDMNLYPIADAKHFVVSFDITFETLEGTDAENVQDAVIMLDDLQLYTDSQSDSDKSYYGLNNSKLIPAIACYNKIASSQTKKDCIQLFPKTTTVTIADQSETTFEGITNCVIPLYIHHLGTGYSLLNLSSYVGQSNAKLSIDSYNIDNNALIEYKRDDGTQSPIVIDYKTHNHLFFLNNETPEYKVLYKEIKDLKTQYSNDSIVFKSPGSVQKITKSKEKIQELTATPYNWFFYCTNDITEEQTPYYTLYAQNAPAPHFPRVAGGKFMYDNAYISSNPSFATVEGLLVPNYSVNVDQIYNDIQNYETIYFGYYDKVSIMCEPMINITLSVTQFNNLLLGGEI